MAREKEMTRDLVPGTRYHPDIRIRGGEEKVGPLRPDDAAKSGKKTGLVSAGIR